MYAYGDNYNPSTGIYIVPYDGLYLIHAMMLGKSYSAAHFIYVDGNEEVFTEGIDSDHDWLSASTSIS